MDLYGAGTHYGWTQRGWLDMLSLAEEYGWQPTRTGPPRKQSADSWDGNYWSNDGQLFYARDAKRFADALELALKSQRGKPLPQTSGRRYVWLASRRERQEVREFIKFCRAGSFRLC